MFGIIPIPSLFVCFIIFCAWLHYEKRKADKKRQNISEAFWEREEQSNHTRNKDISGLPMFRPDESRIPMAETEDENITYYQGKVKNAVGLPMMNLSGDTNTDLKLAYGTGNFNTLSEYDQNFNDFLMNMSNLGKAYFTAGLLQEAADAYAFCLDSGSGKSTDYEALAKIWFAMGTPEKISELIANAERSELPRKAALISRLRLIQQNGRA